MEQAKVIDFCDARTGARQIRHRFRSHGAKIVAAPAVRGGQLKFTEKVAREMDTEEASRGDPRADPPKPYAFWAEYGTDRPSRGARACALGLGLCAMKQRHLTHRRLTCTG